MKTPSPKEILSDARHYLEPSQTDQERMLKKISAAAAGTALIVGSTAAVSGAAKASLIAGPLTAISKGWFWIKLSIFLIAVGAGTYAAVSWSTNMQNQDEMRRPSGIRLHSSNSAIASIQENSRRLSAETAGDLATTLSLHNLSSASSEIAIGEDADRTARNTLVKPRTNLDAAADVDEVDSVLREIAAIKKASAALKSDRPKEALAILNGFEKTSKSGVMAQERNGLRVLALCALHRKSEAVAAERKFLEQFPDSPMADRIRNECRGLE